MNEIKMSPRCLWRPVPDTNSDYLWTHDPEQDFRRGGGGIVVGRIKNCRLSENGKHFALLKPIVEGERSYFSMVGARKVSGKFANQQELDEPLMWSISDMSKDNPFERVGYDIRWGTPETWFMYRDNPHLLIFVSAPIRHLIERKSHFSMIGGAGVRSVAQ